MASGSRSGSGDSEPSSLPSGVSPSAFSMIPSNGSTMSGGGSSEVMGWGLRARTSSHWWELREVERLWETLRRLPLGLRLGDAFDWDGDEAEIVSFGSTGRGSGVESGALNWALASICRCFKHPFSVSALCNSLTYI